MPRHDLDVVSLIFGIAFAVVGFVFLADRDLGLTGKWIWPVLLIAVGVAGLIGSRTRPNGTHGNS